MVSHTPIPYWLSLPWAETRAWVLTAWTINQSAETPPGAA